MARTLTELQKQYNSSSSAQKPGMPPMGGPRGGGPRGPQMAKGKPKNTADTIKRLLKYVSKYKLHLILVAFCMIFSTLTNLVGSYLLAPIINKITFFVAPNLAAKKNVILFIMGASR